MTANQVVKELRSNPRLARTKIFVKASKPDGDIYGDKVNGILAPGGQDLTAAAEAASGEPMNRDREEALQLAARAAETLRLLAGGGKTDVSPSTDTLADTLASRPDAVVLPDLGVLEFVGGPAHVQRITAALTGAERAETVRVAAAKTLAGIFSRAGGADAAVIQVLQGVAAKDASFAVRAATAGALGRLDLGKEARVDLMRSLLGR